MQTGCHFGRMVTNSELSVNEMYIHFITVGNLIKHNSNHPDSHVVLYFGFSYLC